MSSGRLGRAAVAAAQGMGWARQGARGYSDRELASAFPEYEAQKKARRMVAALVDHAVLAAGRGAGSADATNKIVDAYTKRAWESATSFWRDTDVDELEQLGKTGRLGAAPKKRGGDYPFVSVSPDQAEGYGFGVGVLLELDAGAIRSAEGSDAFRVRYMVDATVGPRHGGKEMLDTGTGTGGTLGYPAMYAKELETRLRLDAVPASVITRIYVTVRANYDVEYLSEIYSSFSHIAPIVFVPEGYHGESYDARHSGNADDDDEAGGGGEGATDRMPFRNIIDRASTAGGGGDHEA